VAARVSFDTSFLIDFQRERRRPDEETPAHDYLRANPGIEPVISSVVLGEFSEGFADPTHPLINWLRQTHQVLPIDDEVALVYGSVARTLRARRELIGANDLWIAATALHHDLPVVTADARSFHRVPGLGLHLYRDGAQIS